MDFESIREVQLYQQGFAALARKKYQAERNNVSKLSFENLCFFRGII